MYPQFNQLTKPAKRKVTTAFALSKEELKELSDMGWNPLKKFKQGCATKQDWFELTLRIKFAVELSKDYYELITTMELQESHAVMLQALHRAVTMGTGVWSLTPDELEMASAALEAVDAMQTQVPRRIMAPLLRSCVVQMRQQYVKDEKLAPLPAKY